MNLAAYEHNGQLVERRHFYAVACDPQRSVAVEACAGAGKTWMLVSRILRALLAGSQPQEILAITFTKKAAGEMRQRLQHWLLQFAYATDAQLRQELLDRGFKTEPTAADIAALRGLHLQLLQGGRPVQIRTFHSWFAALLRSAPMAVLQDLGLPTQYELLENDARAVPLVWRRFQSRVAQDPAAKADYLQAVATHGRHQTHKALEAALGKRVEFALADAQGVVDASVEPFALQYPDFADLAEPALRLQADGPQTLLWQAAKLLGASTLVTCTQAASALERGLTDQQPAAITEALLTQKGTPRKLSEKLVGIEVVRQAQALVMDVAAAEHQHQAWLHHQRLARLARGLVEDFAALKRERGWIDMGDLERAALTLMSDTVLSGWVQERLDAQVRHLLIDEFQDTNPLQWQTLRAWLDGYTGAGQAPSVFIVGDPKQSIYRFRRAEPQVFQAAKAFVAEGLGGDLLSCDHTRRNAPVVVDLVNTVMLSAQAAGQFDGYRAHTTESRQAGQCFKLPRLLRERAAAQDDASNDSEPVGWRNSLTTPRREPEETRKALECQQAARWLMQQLRAPGATLVPQDIMVLARKRERLGLMQAELAALGIAAQQPEKADLMDCPEVQDVVALLDVLVSATHDLSLARALKSPLFSVQDDDLVALALAVRAHRERAHEQGGGSTEPGVQKKTPAPSWYAVLQNTPQLSPALTQAAQTLAQWRVCLRDLPPHDALSAIYQQGDVLAKFAVQAPAPRRAAVVANLQAVLSAALQVDGARYLSAYTLVRALRAGGIAAPVRAETQAVRLLTVHGAKGLEAPLVLLLDTDGEAPKPETMGVLVQWPGEAAYPQRFAFVASESRPSACLGPALAQELAARQREELNGLYVALTRTQTTLVVSSMEPHSGAEASWWQRLEPALQDAPWADALASDDSVTAGASPGEKDTPEAIFQLLSLPQLALQPVDSAGAAPKLVAKPETPESRIGQAMHRLLEWVVPQAGFVGFGGWSALQRAQLATQFALEPAQLAQAVQAATGIAAGQGAWVWDLNQLAWHANEVPLNWQGRLLRIDRLVQHQATSEWWVLDFKSNARPLAEPDLCAQLAQYRLAVAHLYPASRVRAAFLTPQGQLFELMNE
ncbi:MAG: DNA helicase UvrD [Burkholderiales bacterium PBB3]|nr:MAG: DNA helicase UvrD [Burkholderiales bacterium PBB3]